MATVESLWLEITGKCQLRCTHCYAESGPTGTQGDMTYQDWAGVLAQAADVGMRRVQFIGGEPTLHPDLPGLVDQALGHGLHVEVYSNLVHVSERLWDTFSCPGVSLATSYYSPSDEQHAAITGRRTRGRTRSNIAEALRRSIPLRVGVVDVNDDQRVAEAVAELRGLGVLNVRVDRVRHLGRAQGDTRHDVSELCGHCARVGMAVSASGEVWPCVMARWMSLGNVRRQSLPEILNGVATERALARIAAQGLDGPPCEPGGDPTPGPQCFP
jgi:MoaA/NifB/PqqE/SkfB family radical SAM enzyme